MMWWLALACIHTPVLDPVAVPVATHVRRLESPPDEQGRTCSWEEEWLLAGAERLVGADEPEACEVLADHWQTVDVLGQNGPFVSVLVESGGCCPVQRAASCQTWDLVNRVAVSVHHYDPRAAVRRWRRAESIAAERGAGALDPMQFYVRGRHVTFCTWDPAGRRVDVPAP
ncbi:MAG: hypothetical protein FJ090_05765 [Deltaproteobacteria bacterium]|nr:hypothetical protein [Deltaproteobacteria bacterium]